MRGLLVKDFLLLKNQKRTLVTYIAIAGVMSFTMDGSFLVSYVMMLGTLLAIATISQDEAENGFSFLLTLPVSAKTYAVEKHLFVVGMAVLSWAVAVAAQLAVSALRGIWLAPLEEIADSLAILAVVLIPCIFTLPLSFQFGREKAAVAMLLFFGVFFLLLTGSDKLSAAFGIDPHTLLKTWAERIDDLSKGVLLALTALLCAVCVLVSMWISVRIMRRKEF